MSELYLGLISGTSADGIDAVLVDFSYTHPQLIATSCTPYPAELRQQVLAFTETPQVSLQQLGTLDTRIGRAFAQAAQQLLSTHHIAPEKVRAIGSHGQNIFHHPHSDTPFTMQIGDPNIIATETGITTIADFRRKDIALGGQGAPLVPAFHQALFRTKEKNRVIVNIGGIANITLLPADFSQPVMGFDTGPGNALMDCWVEQHLQQPHDHHGQWAAQGCLQLDLLQRLLADPYFQLPPPKSTGREYFNLTWLQRFVPLNSIPVNIQTTLAELTARSILTAITPHIAQGEILVCGGGVHNEFLMNRLSELAKNSYMVMSTAAHGINPDWVEAMAFAWLAKQTLTKQPGNIPQVTGAQAAAILGGIYSM
ncbi:MAG: anhydro-N-acetylmuramic acid kinase [Gammaproteobacteria bacterium RIFCSPHIGHO2_12_FULL_41_20]|nr:MAG: anhydro-N-acetylmuramic acid kinase [Gammaproteobacteria bacterium RIFCSPHIGHO2_12_FULL_41_20]